MNVVRRVLQSFTFGPGGSRRVAVRRTVETESGGMSSPTFSSSARKLFKLLINEPLNLHVVVRLSGIALARSEWELNQLALGQT